MNVNFSTYQRIERRAGGIGQPTKRWIKACWGVLHPDAKRSQARELRHDFIRSVLDQRDAALQQFIDWRL